MQFEDVPLHGAKLISLNKVGDERGFFARMFCQTEFAQQGLEPTFVQMNDSLGVKKGTLRGMHYQLPPRSEVKLVRCLRGALWDCIIDLRPDSPTYSRWHGVELTAENRLMYYVPQGFAHAILTLEDNTEALYLVSSSYEQSLERGIRWNDPRFNIRWPIDPVVISEKDAAWPDFSESYHEVDRLRGLL